MIRSPIRTFKTGEYELTRYAAGVLVNGVYIKGSPTTKTVAVSIQPLSGRELENLSESQGTEDLRVCFTEDLDIQTKDEIDYNGEQWRVFRVANWPRHTEFYITKSTANEG